MNKLPYELISEIVSKMDSCKDILNFCITNSKNKDVCKDNSLMMIKTAIKNKYPEFPIDNFLKTISQDFDKLYEEDSKPFSYLDGKGKYQLEFDSMPESRISRNNSYKWSEIKSNLVNILKLIRKGTDSGDVDFLPLTDSVNHGIVLTPDAKSIYDVLKDYKNEINRRDRVPYYLERFNREYYFEKLKKQNFDKFIDEFLLFNKHQWMMTPFVVEKPTKEYERPGNIILLKFPVYYKKGTDKQKYILKILCKILNSSIHDLQTVVLDDRQ